MSCWYKPCPICDGRGRLEIMKNIDEDYLFFCCDECMSYWKNESDLEKRINKFMEYSVNYSRLTPYEC